MDANQILAIEKSMLDEHRKDLEALARLKRFLPPSSSHDGINHRHEATEPKPSVASASEANAEDLSGRVTLVSKALEIVDSSANADWTAKAVLSAIAKQGFPIRNSKPEQGVSLALAALAKRGRIKLVRRGAGSEPNLYRSINADANDIFTSSVS